MAETNPPGTRKVNVGLGVLGLVFLAAVSPALWPRRWPLVVAGCFILGVGALSVVSLRRRWPVIVSVITAFAAAFLLFMPIGCVSEAASGAKGATTTCQNIAGLTLPGFTGSGPGFSPSYWTPLAPGGIAAVAAFVLDRRRRSGEGSSTV
jgi:hypothetical protein